MIDLKSKSIIFKLTTNTFSIKHLRFNILLLANFIFLKYHILNLGDYLFTCNHIYNQFR